ncbi:iron-sulfur cluster assembly 2 mitochondrial [Blastocystis sp. subtype 4]|uniref:iron-sulfur cluster assembly 2 mitochondrial n=1 Tax=Blastocystis sp. subtype 4 TaxID=944170 RepID=UPI0007115807|nr:iron-sulfur cluster assembly 2 mitochondrial [Blastocystis sp. subtype 4]KNB44174.1 iron-sulfur cluster assembly 2 mitochondrial [Blastocystis sp. subtype 4]|eukprot:XP_014527617.1 iron-sulfur cluster assembly 2 mitochondrial [Blastocystis sp. subtype 4]
MTPDCAKHIQKIAQKKSKSLDDVHLRIHVQSGGCSGLQYKFTMDYDKVYDYDKEFVDSTGARIVVDTVSFPYVKGCVVDWQDDLVRTGFTVAKNPNAAASCSCGTSFTAKSDSRYD